MHFSVRNEFCFRCCLNCARDTKGRGFSRGMFYLLVHFNVRSDIVKCDCNRLKKEGEFSSGMSLH